MNRKCTGCGAILQYQNPQQEGYLQEKHFLEKEECERCFRIKNYGEYKTIMKDSKQFTDMLQQIDKTNDLIVLVVDLWNISPLLSTIKEYLHRKVLLVLTKRDILPKRSNDEKYIEFMNQFDLPILDTIMVSSIHNLGIDEVYEKIQRYQTSPNVYVVGFTNSGKSTLINKMIHNYSELTREITTSMLPNTTLQEIAIPLSSSITLIDTPGLLDEGCIFYYVDAKLLKKILPRKEIKPITYQIHTKQSIFIESLVRIDVENTNVSCFISNQLKIERRYKDSDDLKTMTKHILHVKNNEDIVVSGLGFFKFTKPCQVTLYTLEGVNVFIRPSLI